jgi:nucleotidyltransferase substrate binding protein (TIGR01987 family)
MQDKQLDSFIALGKALTRLQEALAENPEKNSLAIDATIQRFEFCIELFWKVLKKFLQEEGSQAKSPKEALQEAFQLEWIHDEQLWLTMLADRNSTSQTYNEELALKIYSHLHNYYQKMNEVYQNLNKKNP